MIDINDKHKARFEYVKGMCKNKETLNEITLKDWRKRWSIYYKLSSIHTANWYDMQVELG